MLKHRTSPIAQGATVTPPSEPFYPVNDGMKICSNKNCKLAGAPQPTANFPPNKTIKCGLNPACRACLNAYKRGWKSKQPEKARSKSAKARNSAAGKLWRANNRDKLLRYCKEWNINNPDKAKFLHIVARFRRYGVTPDWYEKTLEGQNGRCAICGGKDPKSNGGTFHVDHDHRCCTKECSACDKCRRGLLCGPCNSKLGHLENVEWTKKAIRYLKKFRSLELKP